MRRSEKPVPYLSQYVPCWTCGKKIAINLGMPTLRAFCEPCEKAYNENKSSTLKEYVRLKAIIMHERAMRILEKQRAPLYYYKEASEAVLEFALKPGEKFSSSHEMVAAMELIRNEIQVKTQQTIGSYRVDFVLPELKVIFEVDGYMHKVSKIKDSQRDIDLRLVLGAEWEVVRISTQNIEKHILKLVSAIEGISDYKREVRSKNKGILPEWYSDREHKHYTKVVDKFFTENIEKDFNEIEHTP